MDGPLASPNPKRVGSHQNSGRPQALRASFACLTRGSPLAPARRSGLHQPRANSVGSRVLHGKEFKRIAIG